MKWWPYYEKWFWNERYQAKTAPLLTPATPSRPPTPVLLPAVWIMIDLLQMGRRKQPLIFQCFIKKYLFTVVSLGHGRDLSRQFPNGAWSKKGWFSLPHNKMNDLQYYFRNESINSVTKWILIKYNETWVWLELSRRPHNTFNVSPYNLLFHSWDKINLIQWTSLMVNPHISSILLTNVRLLFDSFLMLHTISLPDLWINSVLVVKRL